MFSKFLSKRLFIHRLLFICLIFSFLQGFPSSFSRHVSISNNTSISVFRHPFNTSLQQSFYGFYQKLFLFIFVKCRGHKWKIILFIQSLHKLYIQVRKMIRKQNLYDNQCTFDNVWFMVRVRLLIKTMSNQCDIKETATPPL